MAIKFKKNDQITVISGSNKGKVGKIISIKDNRVVVEGVNLVTIHKKKTSTQSSSILKVERSIHISNISLIENGKPIKVIIRNDFEGIVEDTSFNKKVRISKKTGNRIG